MLCEKCGQREATIHLLQCTSPGGITLKKDLCEECGKDQVSDLEKITESQHTEWLRTVEPILSKDSRYHEAAYGFIIEAMSIAQVMKSPFGDVPALAQVSAKELMEVLRTIALLRLGKNAKRRLNEWGIRRCEDFGEIALNLMDAGLLRKRPEDRKEGFRGGYDFDEAFPEN